MGDAMSLIEVLRGHLAAAVDDGSSVRSIATAVNHSQPQVRAFLRGETEGSGPLLADLADHFGLQLLSPLAAPKECHKSADGLVLWPWANVWIRHNAIRADGTWPVQHHTWNGKTKGRGKNVQLRLVRYNEPQRGCWRRPSEIYILKNKAEGK